jgi:cytoskeletal protein RodZ
MSIDPSRDNPLIRFASFWWGLATFFAFALILALVILFNRNAPETLEDEAAKARYQTKAEVIAAQAASLTPEAIEAAIPAVAVKLAASKPAAVEKPEQAVPGATPQAAPAAPTAEAPAPAPEAAPAVAEPTPATH